MNFVSEAAKEALKVPYKPKPSRELQRYPGSTFARLRESKKPFLVLAPLANVTGTA